MRAYSLLLLVALAGSSSATTPAYQKLRPCSEPLMNVCRAFELGEPEEIDRLLRTEFRQALLSQDATLRGEAFYLLAGKRWQIDIRPYFSMIEEFATLDRESDRAARFIRSVAFDYAPRETRRHAYERAIVDGSFTTTSGLAFGREVAIRCAANEGFVELREMVRANYDRLSNPVKQSFLNLEEVLAELELRAGAQNVFDAWKVGAGRLAAMDPAEIAKRLDAEPGFRAAVVNLARTACFRFRDEPCQAIVQIEDRLRALDRAERSVRRASGRPADEAPLPESRDAWLSSLAKATRHSRMIRKLEKPDH